MSEKNISMAVIRRLPKYHAYLGELLKKDQRKISSRQLSEITGFTASQIRQDLNNFGGFGQQGYGYNIEMLYNEIGKILGIDKSHSAILIGAGNLGQAIFNYTGFNSAHFSIKGIFDVNKEIIGTKMKDVEVLDINTVDKFIKENNIEIAILCIPKNNAQQMVDVLVENKIKGIWNFSSTDLEVPESVIVENVNITESLLTLSYLIKEKQ